jgi:4-hydroxy-tetrahydrodipicolinate reductase
MKKIKVIVNGASGRMGQEVINALCQEPDMQIVGAVDIKATEKYLNLPDGSGGVPLSTSLEAMLASHPADVVVDFSNAKATMKAANTAIKSGVNMVIGTTGLTAGDIKEIEILAKANKVGVVVAPNFALGAVLMMHLAKLAAKHFDFAEIIELHHHLKADSPSGTALATAKAMAKARGKPFSTPQGKASDSRGGQVEGVTVHSVRLPGLMAHQEVLLGGAGQTLSIRHDTIGRQCYMPGVMLAIREVANHQGLIYGLERLLGLEEVK